MIFPPSSAEHIYYAAPHGGPGFIFSLRALLNSISPLFSISLSLLISFVYYDGNASVLQKKHRQEGVKWNVTGTEMEKGREKERRRKRYLGWVNCGMRVLSCMYMYMYCTVLYMLKCSSTQLNSKWFGKDRS